VSGHIDTPPPAEVVFHDSLAALVTDSGRYAPNPSYNYSTLECNNTFCHGNWRLRKDSQDPDIQFVFTDSIMRGAAYSPKWTGGSAEAECGTCHGLPPAGHLHYAVTRCNACHGDVIDPTGHIQNKSKHMNGRINLIDGFGGELKF
jgi:predicted CxxxxCH...CXXCH cytochrome family protein